MSFIKSNKKAAFFFTLDTLMAGLIMTLTLMILLSIYFSRPVVEDVQHELTNYVNFISSTTMKDIKENFQPVYEVVGDSELDLFVHQEIFRLSQEDGELAKEFINALTVFILPAQINMEYAVDDFKHTRQLRRDKEFSKSVVTTNILTFFVDNESNMRFATTNITMWS